MYKSIHQYENDVSEVSREQSSLKFIMEWKDAFSVFLL
jgi:hypothetical protein